MIIFSLLSSLIPLIGAIILYFLKIKNKKIYNLIVIALISISSLFNIILCFIKEEGAKTLFKITSDLLVELKVDTLSNFFSIIISIVFIIVTIFSIEYFKDDENKNHFDCFFLLSYSALMMLCYSGNLITMYITFEMVTLFSMPLVLHNKTKESIDAALKYLIYSVGGAFLGFIGVVYLTLNGASSFVLGGSLPSSFNANNIFLVIMLITLIGFGTKCGMFPLHNWLPTAHPVAPAPASSILSSIITKSGVICIIRIVYYVVGTSLIKNTWMQYTWLSLIMITILLGSFMAVVQKNFKKRLAFSSVSQISYVLLGIALLDETAFVGSLLQVASHAFIKVGLFLVTGVLIHLLNIHSIDELEGSGKRMPITMWCYTILSLGLVGVPPTSGFVAKYYLATGGLNSSLNCMNILAPITLIISAILTAYYLLSITIQAFFPQNKEIKYERIKEPLLFTLPLIVLSILTVGLGIFSYPLIQIILSIL